MHPQISSPRPSAPTATIIERIHFLIRSSGDESEPVRGAYSRHNPTHPAAGQIWRAKFNYSLTHQRSVPYTPQLYEIMISFIFLCCMERAQTPEKMPPAPAQSERRMALCTLRRHSRRSFSCGERQLERGLKVFIFGQGRSPFARRKRIDSRVVAGFVWRSFLTEPKLAVKILAAAVPKTRISCRP